MTVHPLSLVAPGMGTKGKTTPDDPYRWLQDWAEPGGCGSTDSA